MSYRRNKAAVFAIAGISLAAMSGTAMADVLIANASGAIAREYQRGSRVPTSTRFELERGDRLSIVANGEMRRFRGPGTYSVTGPRSQSGSNRTRRNVPRTGASRNPDDLAAAIAAYPNRRAWQIDVSESGAVCYVPVQSVTLWRPNIDEPREVTITRMSDQATATVTFDDGQASHDWPEQFAASGGAEYRINWVGNIVATRISFTQLNAEASDVGAVGAALFENGCESQFDALMAEIESDTETAADEG